LSGSAVHVKGFGSALCSTTKRLMAACKSTTDRKTPRFNRRFVSLAKKPSTAQPLPQRPNERNLVCPCVRSPGLFRLRKCVDVSDDDAQRNRPCANAKIGRPNRTACSAPSTTCASTETNRAGIFGGAPAKTSRAVSRASIAARTSTTVAFSVLCGLCGLRPDVRVARWTMR
jgi:hypothetical protein